MNVLVIIIIVISIVIIGLLIFDRVRKKKTNDLTGGDKSLVNEKTVITKSTKVVYLLIDEFVEMNDIIDSITKTDDGYMIIDSKSDDLRMRLKKEIESKVWNEVAYIPISNDQETLTTIANQLEDYSKPIESVVLIGKPYKKDDRITCIDRSGDGPITRIFGNEFVDEYFVVNPNECLYPLLTRFNRVKPIVSDCTPFANGIEDIIVNSFVNEQAMVNLSYAFNDYSRKNGITLNSNSIKFLGSGSYNMVFLVDEFHILRVAYSYPPDFSQNETNEANRRLMESEIPTGFAKVIDYGNGWTLVERLYPIELPIDEDKMKSMCDSLRTFFNNSFEDFGFTDFASRNVMQTINGEYVIADIDILMIGSQWTSLKSVIPFDNFIDRWISMGDYSTVMELLRSIVKANNPKKKKISPRDLSIMAINLFELARYRSGVFVTPELKNMV